MLFKILQIQKHIHEASELSHDPTRVHTMISEFVLRTFTLGMIIVSLGTVGFGVLGLLFQQPGWWILCGIGCVLLFGLFVVRWIVQTIIRRMVTTFFQAIKNNTTHTTVGVIDVIPDR